MSSPFFCLMMRQQYNQRFRSFLFEMCNGENLNKKGEKMKIAQTAIKCALISCTKKNDMCNATKKIKK